MPKGFSLHIGLDAVNPNYYDGWRGTLTCPVADAFAMYQLATQQKFDDRFCLFDEQATRANILTQLKRLAKEATAKDLVLITYSGHGARLPNPIDPTDPIETWCCFDGMLMDKELRVCWSKFKKGVRILIVSDSCHSGGVAREPIDDPIERALGHGGKFLTQEKVQTIFKVNENTYSQILEATPYVDVSRLRARVLLLAACEPQLVAYEDEGNSLYTKCLLKVWDKGMFRGNYKDFAKAIALHMQDTEQIPATDGFGNEKDSEFDASQPFHIDQTSMLIAPKMLPKQDIVLLVEANKTSKEWSNKYRSLTSYTIGDKTVERLVPKVKTAVSANPWDAAHDLRDTLKREGRDIGFVEPDLAMSNFLVETNRLSKTGGAQEPNEFMSSWPHPLDEDKERSLGDYRLWHLDDEHSQLASVRDELMADEEFRKSLAETPIKIAHIDTGFFKSDSFTPKHPDFNNQFQSISMMDDEMELMGFDYVKNSFRETQGHGTATLAILAGPKPADPRVKGMEGYEGYIGAIPFANILTIRINDTVALFRTSTFERAMEYAIANKCEVITMSMGGEPSKRWADVVNKAYEKGITIVTAAGNSFRKGFFERMVPEHIIFPARFHRVIAAVGVTYNQQPYVFEANDWEKQGQKTAGGVNMQGNHGPDRHMKHALAAYTPNVFWTETNQIDENGNTVKHPQPYFSMLGGGTSSATPQIAAAAAMWIAKHRKALEDKGYAGNWRQVEAVRHALFTTADKSNSDGTQFEIDTYLGNGRLRAMEAFKSEPIDEANLVESPIAEAPLIPYLMTLFNWAKSKVADFNVFKTMPPTTDDADDAITLGMLSWEFAQLIATTPELTEIDAIDWEQEDIKNTEAYKYTILEVIRRHPSASNRLKSKLKVAH
jgi:hypothetical protein